MVKIGYSMLMRGKFLLKSAIAIILVIIASVSCKSNAQTKNDSEMVEVGTRQPGVFDPARITQEQYIATRSEVQQFIENLNQIIRSRNYNAWRACLSSEYFAQISSQDNLQRISAQPAMRTRRIVLRTAEDYFIHVVVASRAEVALRVDDIEFITQNRVRAFTIRTNSAGEEQRVILYDLEKVGDSWIIIN